MTSQVKNTEAEGIADDLLYRTGRALVLGDVENVHDCFVLPQVMETLEGARLVREPEDVRRVFEGVRAYFAENNVTDIVRTIVEATFLEPGVIESVHASRLMQPDGQVFRNPYPVYSRLDLCDDGVWRIALSNYAISDSREHSEALLTWRSGDPN